jgi:hypothetical protein
MEENNKKGWMVELGFYPGILLGIRTYEEENFTTYVIYLPLVDIAITIEK